jgi:hypothetical protein
MTELRGIDTFAARVGGSWVPTTQAAKKLAAGIDEQAWGED